MLCYEISVLCYAMVYDVKDKHSATVSPIEKGSGHQLIKLETQSSRSSTCRIWRLNWGGPSDEPKNRARVLKQALIDKDRKL